jgi:phage gp16-like protein
MTDTARASDHRNSLLAKVHIAKKELDLDDEVYRDIIERKFNERSAGKLNTDQLVLLVEELKRHGFRGNERPKNRADESADVPRETINEAKSDVIAKMRALWLSLYHLGAVEDPGDSALEAFAERQTKAANGVGIAKLAWLPPQDAFRVIEALKHWATREGVDWSAFKDPRDCVLAALAKKCMALGMFGSVAEVSAYQTRHMSTNRRIELIGEKLRALLKTGKQ